MGTQARSACSPLCPIATLANRTKIKNAGIRHIELAHSEDLELIEITSPAEFATINVAPP